MLELKSKDKFHITGRGDVFVVDLPGGLTATDMIKIRKESGSVKIDNTLYQVYGVESFRLTDSTVGLLVQESGATKRGEI